MIGMTMKMIRQRTRSGSLIIAVAALACAALVAPRTAAGQTSDLPNARELIDRHVEAIGGREALLAHRSLRAVGSFTITSMGMSGTFEIFQRRPNEFTSVIEVSGLGQIRRGFDGTVGWSTSPLEGPRVFEGMELAQLKDEADMSSALRDTSVVTAATTIERTEMGGKPCYLVQLTWKSGRESFDCYSMETGFLIATRGTQYANVGAVEATTILGEYKQFGDIMMAGTSRQQMMGLEQMLTVESVEFDSVEEAAFELPAEIKALIGG